MDTRRKITMARSPGAKLDKPGKTFFASLRRLVKASFLMMAIIAAATINTEPIPQFII